MKKIKAIWELMRLEHGIMLALAIFIGSIIALQSQAELSVETFPWIKFVLTFFTALFLEASTFALNDYYDRDIDIKNKRYDRPLARGDIQPKTALYLFYILFPLGLLTSYFVTLSCFVIALFTAIFAIVYDVYLKKIKLLGNFYVAYTMAIPFIFGAVAVDQQAQLFSQIEPAIYIIACIAFLAGSGREIMKDVMDYEGDKTEGVKSFPCYIGIQKSNMISSVFYLIAVGLSLFPFLFKSFGIYYMNVIYLLLIGVTDVIFLTTAFQLTFNSSLDMAGYRKLTLIAIFFGLCSFFIAAFF